MAYFSNGSEGAQYQEIYCVRCANYRDKDDGRGPGCPVWDVHLLYAYEEANETSNAKYILDILIPIGKDNFAAECSMFFPERGDAK